ncbi:hypothetical protein [Pseudomonas azotoformans]|jgi:predicted nucleotidyltransferase
MIATANNLITLKKRVLRFFESPKRAEVKHLIRVLSKGGEVLVFGGLLRDIALYGGDSFNSDIDLVVDCSPAMLFDFFEMAAPSAKKNHFGGYRVKVGGWSIDVWPIKKTWAFASGHVSYEDRSSLLLTTITNWDAIAFSFKDGALIAGENYIDSLLRKELDIVLVENPNRQGAFLRVLKLIFDKQVEVLLPGAVAYLKLGFEDFTPSELFSWQRDAFGRVYFSLSEITYFQRQVCSLERDFFGMPIFLKGTNLGIEFA